MKTIIKLFLAVVFIAAMGCEDILEEDITNDMITVTYPLNNTQIESNVANFQWMELDGADDYRIQIFSTSQNVVLDSLVPTNHFTYSLAPGEYQWRVRGENFAYQTAYTFPLSFTMIETSDLTNQQLQLTNPSNNLYTQNTTPSFSWTGINAAEYYSFMLINVTDGNQIIHEEDEITGTSLTLGSSIITEDGQYQWRVKAVNSESETQYSTRTFYVDRTAPNSPQNMSPADETSVNPETELTFEWSPSEDTGVVISAVSYIFEISTTENFSNIIHTATPAIPSYDYTFVAEDTYYWRVKCIDEAGNQSGYSVAYQITVE